MVYGTNKFDSLQNKFQKSKYNTDEAGKANSYKKKKILVNYYRVSLVHSLLHQGKKKSTNHVHHLFT